ncbi:hypothetical protein [Coleofasciculus sp.]
MNTDHSASHSYTLHPTWLFTGSLETCVGAGLVTSFVQPKK